MARPTNKASFVCQYVLLAILVTWPHKVGVNGLYVAGREGDRERERGRQREGDRERETERERRRQREGGRETVRGRQGDNDSMS